MTPLKLNKSRARAPQTSSLATYVDWLESSVSQYETLAKNLVSHRAEKGRIVEAVVKSALRTVLPNRFSIGTGFLITSSGRASPQLDLVIYDHLYNSPIVLEGGVGLFPMECVFATIEVKSVLDTEEIESATKTIRLVRDLAKEKRYVMYATEDSGDGKLVAVEKEMEITLSPRTFVFAIRSDLSKATLIEKVKASTEKNGAHIHGLLVLKTGFFLQQKLNKPPGAYEFNTIDRGGFPDFCATVLSATQSMPMFPASMRPYFKSTG